MSSELIRFGRLWKRFTMPGTVTVLASAFNRFPRTLETVISLLQTPRRERERESGESVLSSFRFGKVTSWIHSGSYQMLSARDPARFTDFPRLPLDIHCLCTRSLYTQHMWVYSSFVRNGHRVLSFEIDRVDGRLASLNKGNSVKIRRFNPRSTLLRVFLGLLQLMAIGLSLSRKF